MQAIQQTHFPCGIKTRTGLRLDISSRESHGLFLTSNIQYLIPGAKETPQASGAYSPDIQRLSTPFLGYRYKARCAGKMIV